MHVFEKEFIDVSNCKVLGDYTVIKEENGILVISKDSNYGLANLQGKIIHDINLKKVLFVNVGEMELANIGELSTSLFAIDSEKIKLFPLVKEFC